MAYPFNEDYNGAKQEGASPLQFTIKDNRRHSTATAFLKPVMHRKNLSVRTGCHVARIIIEKGVAKGVEIVTGEKIFCRREIILSAGAFQSPQLLMLSGIGDEKALQHLIYLFIIIYPVLAGTCRIMYGAG